MRAAEFFNDDFLFREKVNSKLSKDEQADRVVHSFKTLHKLYYQPWHRAYVNFSDDGWVFCSKRPRVIVNNTPESCEQSEVYRVIEATEQDLEEYNLLTDEMREQANQTEVEYVFESSLYTPQGLGNIKEWIAERKKEADE